MKLSVFKFALLYEPGRWSMDTPARIIDRYSDLGLEHNAPYFSRRRATGPGSFEMRHSVRTVTMILPFDIHG